MSSSTTTKASKWTSLQSVLAQEEDREQAGRAAAAAVIAPAQAKSAPELSPDSPTSLVTETNHNADLSLVPQARLVKTEPFGWSETSLAVETSLATETELEINSTQSRINLMSSVPTTKGFNKQYYELIDHLYPLLDSYEQTVHSHLFRLAWGFNKPNCVISLPGLAKRCGMSVKSAQRTTARLEEKGLIEKVRMILGKGREQGVEFRVAPPPSLAAETRLVTEARLVPQTTIKETHIKKHTQQTATIESTRKELASQDVGVGVKSKFTIAQCRDYADNLQRAGQGINNPGGYATTIHRSGEADAQIESFLNPAEQAKNAVDSKLCPDCHGTGFWEPGGAGKGVAKCKHERLTV